MPVPLGFWAVAGAGAAGGETFELISTAYGTGSNNTVTFSSIPSYYKHLQIRMVVRSTTNDYVAKLTGFNGDTGSNYAFHRLIAGNGSIQATASSSQAYIWTAIVRNAANIASTQIIDILDYANTSKNKTVRIFGGESQSDSQVQLNSGLWLNTAAISSLSLVASGNWTSDSRFSLYGIRG